MHRVEYLYTWTDQNTIRNIYDYIAKTLLKSKYSFSKTRILTNKNRIIKYNSYKLHFKNTKNIENRVKIARAR